MIDFPRFTINRSLIVLLPNAPALEWIVRVDPSPPKMTLEELRQEQDGFLVSERKIETIEDARRWVHRNWAMLFEHFLFDWYTDESMWPAHRNLKMFKEWFDIRYHPMIWDMAAEPLEHEDWEPEDDSAVDRGSH